MIVLGIETSCDETSAGVVEDGRKLLSLVTATSMDLHVAYGGVVPEIAARSHIESIIPVIDQALREAFSHSSTKSEILNSKQTLKSQISNLKSSDPWDQIDAIAVTYGAGLGGCLLVGVTTAKTLSLTKSKPLYAVNHVEGHVYANFITEISTEYEVRSEELSTSNNLVPRTTYVVPKSQPAFPILGLIVSGKHTQLVLFKDHFDYIILGKTKDDAIGEAFDKVAKLLGLPYPGGPSIAKAALAGDPYKYSLPKARLDPGVEILDFRRKILAESPQISNLKSNISYDFSFSGLKTAVLRLSQEQIGEDFAFPSFSIAERLSETQKRDIASSFQRTAVETVVDKTILAFNEFNPKSVIIAGGASANLELRRQLAEKLPIAIDYTDVKLCTDNGAMIAVLGYYKVLLGQEQANPYSLDIEPSLSM